MAFNGTNRSGNVFAGLSNTNGVTYPIATHPVVNSRSFWYRQTHYVLSDGSAVNGTNTQLMGMYPELMDTISSAFKAWSDLELVDELCDYPSAENCHKIQVRDDDWEEVAAELVETTQKLYDALTADYRMPSSQLPEPESKFMFEKAQKEAIETIQQKLSTPAGCQTAYRSCQRLARTIVSVNKNGISDERDMIVQAIEDDKLIALDVASFRLHERIARDPEFEVKNKISHSRSNLARSRKLYNAQVAAGVIQPYPAQSATAAQGTRQPHPAHRRAGDPWVYRPTAEDDAVVLENTDYMWNDEIEDKAMEADGGGDHDGEEKDSDDDAEGDNNEDAEVEDDIYTSTPLPQQLPDPQQHSGADYPFDQAMDMVLPTTEPGSPWQ
ncbi:hypothetical protein LTR62_003961 [Meristemomyces frigidus]|uniref:Uncharacterized protein n=1 Tax=Meristemomyces frigidus TaxID=1508187 RepID=A0AAN7TGF5_9PEZI|nr:hypothetical protein LTR62_003961 [Meristemomyces frigidus]